MTTVSGVSHQDPIEREQQQLASWGMRSGDSRGRTHAESDDANRTAFQRDRDRIIHCAAFRRLEYKTQVFVNHEGDHYRTRLTHTLEVAQISRAAARLLGLNEDLVEAIALSHDLGHPPFGHAGEVRLDALMAADGGFDHNDHCLRVVTLLEQRYPDFPGLNLSWEVREAAVKHGSEHASPWWDDYEPDLAPTLEAQLVDACDSLAYSNHDIDDGVRSGSITVEGLRAVDLWRNVEARVEERWPGITGRQRLARTVSRLIDGQILDLVEASRERLLEAGIDSAQAAQRAGTVLVDFSSAQAVEKRELHEFLHDRLYRHPHTLKAASKGQRFIAAIFRAYEEEPGLLPEDFRQRLETEGQRRVICDYVAGMTDRFCSQEYTRLFLPFGDGPAAGVEAR